MSKILPRNEHQIERALRVVVGRHDRRGHNASRHAHARSAERARWGVPTASFALQGYGLWEVCDGMNYRGNCRVLAGAASAAAGPSYRPLRNGSARRVAFANDPRNAIGLLASGVTAQTAETLHKLSKG